MIVKCSPWFCSWSRGILDRSRSRDVRWSPSRSRRLRFSSRWCVWRRACQASCRATSHCSFSPWRGRCVRPRTTQRSGRLAGGWRVGRWQTRHAGGPFHSPWCSQCPPEPCGSQRTWRCLQIKIKFLFLVQCSLNFWKELHSCHSKI